jgi:tetratricopeptide (TPR) repeat protein
LASLLKVWKVKTSTLRLPWRKCRRLYCNRQANRLHKPQRPTKAYYDSGKASLGKRDYDNAISDYNESIRLDPNYAPAYNDREDAYYHLGNFDKAISDYSDAIRLNRNLASAYLAHAYYNRGLAYAKKGNFDNAISDYNEAIRLDNSSLAYNNRGIAYANQRNYAKAITDFTEAIRLDPYFASAYDNRGFAYLHTGNRAKAAADFATAERLMARHCYWRSTAGMSPNRSRMSGAIDIHSQMLLRVRRHKQHRPKQ